MATETREWRAPTNIVARGRVLKRTSSPTAQLRSRMRVNGIDPVDLFRWLGRLDI
jgi:hypothetical protein